jgi:L-fuculose-phosphate aldolase
MEDFQSVREEICRAGKLLYDRGYAVCNDGNISVRIGEDKVLITPSGVSKGRMSPDMLVVTDLEGRVLSGDRYPSSESKMHYMVYKKRPDAGAVVHAHPPVSTAYAVCRKPLREPYLAEMIIGLGGEVPVTEFAMLSTDEVPRSIEPFLAERNAVLLANHGALAWGESLWPAFDLLEMVEHTAKINLNVALLGGGILLADDQVATLLSMRDNYRKLAGRRE